MKTKQITGTISHGTMRPQDLIPSFLDALEAIAPDAYAQMMVSSFGPVPAYVYDEGDDSEWWDSDDAGYLLESLFDALDENSPEGFYFGAHPGDGSDYGFWQVEQDD